MKTEILIVSSLWLVCVWAIYLLHLAASAWSNEGDPLRIAITFTAFILFLATFALTVVIVE